LGPKSGGIGAPQAELRSGPGSGQAERSGPAGPQGAGPVEGLRGVGTAASGRVRAEVSAGGRLESLTIDPGLLRAGLTSVADVVVEAVQAAQDDAVAKAADLQAGAVPSSAGLTAAAQAAAAGTARLEAMLAELARVGDRLGGSGGGSGPATPGRGRAR
jgi:DNA-binding protein YbaB